MNTAGRLLSIYDKLTGKGWPHDKGMVWIWAEVFGLPQDAPHLEDEVVTCLQATRTEMELLRVKMLSLGASEDLLQPGLARFRNAVSPVYLNQQWSGLQGETAKPENRVPLAWANWVLRDEKEEDLPEDKLAALREEIDNLEASLQDTDMTPYLRSFIKRQLETIRSALKLYRVKGATPIGEAVEQVAGAYTVQRSKVESECRTASEPAKNVIGRFRSVLKTTAEVASTVQTIKETGQELYELGKTVWEALPFGG